MFGLLEKGLWRGGWIGWLASLGLRLRWWKISYIPGPEVHWRALFKRDQVYADGSIKPSFFRDRRGGLSCDLARLSTTKRSRRGYVPPPWPEESGLVAFRAHDVRDSGSDVDHFPLKEPAENYSHCQFTQQLTKKGEVHLADAARFAVEQRVRDVKSE